VHEDEAACGTALKASSRVIVVDVLTSDIFVGKSSLKVLLNENVRAVTSTPLMCSGGVVLGMVSTHFSKRNSPTERELHFLDLLARQASDYLERRGAQEREKLLLREVQHRSNNLLAVIHSIAQRTFSGDIPLEAAREAFEGRLMALSRANKHITSSNGGVQLSELIELHLQPFAERVLAQGPR
jgi:GAF domain-containing protein